MYENLGDMFNQANAGTGGYGWENSPTLDQAIDPLFKNYADSRVQYQAGSVPGFYDLSGSGGGDGGNGPGQAYQQQQQQQQDYLGSMGSGGGDGGSGYMPPAPPQDYSLYLPYGTLDTSGGGGDGGGSIGQANTVYDPSHGGAGYWVDKEWIPEDAFASQDAAKTFAQDWSNADLSQRYREQWDTDAERWEGYGQLKNYGTLEDTHSAESWLRENPWAIGNNQFMQGNGGENTFGNDKDEILSGEDALIGTRRLMKDGQIQGYFGSNINPLIEQWKQKDNFTSGTGVKHSIYDQGRAAVGRQYNDPNWWANNTKSFGNAGWYMGADQAQNNPGWTNKDAYERQVNDVITGKTGVSRYAPAVAMAAMAAMTGGALGPALGAAMGSTAAGTAAAGAVGALPGALRTGLNGGNWTNALGGIATGALGSYLGGTYGGSMGLPSNVGKGLIQGGVNMAGKAAMGQDVDWLSSLSGIASGIGGGYIGDAAQSASGATGLLGDIIKSGVGGLSSSTIQSLLQGKTPDEQQMIMTLLSSAAKPVVGAGMNMAKDAIGSVIPT